MNRYLAEFIGTFALVFAGTGAIVINAYTKDLQTDAARKTPVVVEMKDSLAKFAPPASGELTHIGIALSFGLVVMGMVYAFGDISGAHLNPAVTVGLAVRGRFAASQVAPYIVSQCAGALLASLTLFVLFPSDHTYFGATQPLLANSASKLLVPDDYRAFVFEVILTGLLMFTVLGVTSGGQIKGLFAGLAVGGVVGLEALFAGPICGASMNPARSLAPAIISNHYEYLWIYLAGPLAGALFAACAWPLLENPSTNQSV